MSINGLVEAAAACAALATLLSFGGRWRWILELATHFRVHYFVGLSIGGLFAAITKRWLFAAIFAASAAINLALIVPHYLPVQGDAAGGRQIRIMLANVNLHNREHDRFCA